MFLHILDDTTRQVPPTHWATQASYATPSDKHSYTPRTTLKPPMDVLDSSGSAELFVHILKIDNELVQIHCRVRHEVPAVALSAVFLGCNWLPYLLEWAVRAGW